MINYQIYKLVRYWYESCIKILIRKRYTQISILVIKNLIKKNIYKCIMVLYLYYMNYIIDFTYFVSYIIFIIIKIYL